MSTSVTSVAAADFSTPVEEQSRATLWPCYVQLLGITSIAVGILWDISWHETIGRDTFWTPAHIAIYLGGVLGGLVSAWIVFQATFVPSSPHAVSAVRILGLRGPIGAWIAMWGAAAMLISAPFDDWWHNTYGLDVKILSPPHSVLAAGMHHVVVGVVMLVLSVQNRAADSRDRTGRLLFIYASGIMLTVASVMLLEYSFPNEQHNATFYFAVSIIYPGILVAVARSAKVAWPATTIAAFYMLFYLLLIWFLPLFSARAHLAPIYNPVEHMVPPPFPLWLIVPALAVDVIIRWVQPIRRWYLYLILAPVLGLIFLGGLMAVQWPFSKFLISPAADNWFFSGQGHWPYWSHLTEWRFKFWNLDTAPITVKSFSWAALAATVSATVGLLWGGWMARVKR